MATIQRFKSEQWTVGIICVETFKSFLTEHGQKAQGFIKRIKVRVRAGKVQRNIKKAGRKGYSFRGGKLVRMSAHERIARKRGALRAKIKRRAKAARIILKRKRSLRRRASLGLK